MSIEKWGDAPKEVFAEKQSVEQIDIPSASTETISPEKEFFENSRHFGVAYDAMVRSLADQNFQQEVSIEELTEANLKNLKELQLSTSFHTLKQHELFISGSYDAQKLLSQVYKSPEQATILADDSHYELEELSPGTYAVHIDMDTYAALRGSTNQVAGAAQCVPVRDGISFVLITRTVTYNEKYHRENREERIPHETHHLVWDYIKRDGKLASEYEDPHLNINFLAYQEEVLAKLTGNQYPTGYLYLNLLQTQDREAFKEEYPQKFTYMQEYVSSLNEILEEIESVRSLTAVARKELIGGVMSAKTFEELQENLSMLKAALEAEPKVREPEQEDLGWGW